MFVSDKFREGFSLIELLTIVIVLGILIAFAIPGYMNTKLKVRDYEGRSNLVLIQTAEKNYRIESRSYIAAANTSQINELLRLDIPEGGYWNYSVPNVDNNLTPPTFCAEAVHPTEGSWHIDHTLAEASDCDCALGNCTGRQ